MIPTPSTLSTLFQVQRRFAVPLYQRQYVWKEENHSRLWDMVTEKAGLRAANRNTKPRFLGTVVLSPYSFGSGLRTDLIVDGQQRLTTLQIFLAAFRDIAIERKYEQMILLLDQMTKNIVAPTQPAEDAFKVTPTKLDQAQFALCLTARSATEVEQHSKSAGATTPLKLVAAYQRFRAWILEYLEDNAYGPDPSERAQNLMNALMTDLLIVTIDLNNDEDPQEITGGFTASLPLHYLPGSTQCASTCTYFWGPALQIQRFCAPRRARSVSNSCPHVDVTLETPHCIRTCCVVRFSVRWTWIGRGYVWRWRGCWWR